jgi:hypothetical protein
LSHFLSDVSSSSAGGLRTSYKTAHDLKFGLDVSERNPTTSAVASARCLFCLKRGRTTVNDSSRKSARTENVQYYRVPFRTENMKTHAEKQHPDAFEEYSSLGVTEKKSHFDDVNCKSTLHAHFDGEKSLRFMINQDIKDVVIDEMLFDPDDVEAPTRARAHEIFFEDTDRSEDRDKGVNVEAYEVTITSSRCFDLVAG